MRQFLIVIGVLVLAGAGQAASAPSPVPTISGVLAGLAGALIAPIYKAQPVMDVPMLIKGLAAAILGGLTNPWGAMVGGLCLGVIESFGAHWGGSSWADVITYAVILVMLMIRPEGLLGKPAMEKA
jgi:branched-chain amino acid transport system permease protein